MNKINEQLRYIENKYIELYNNYKCILNQIDKTGTEIDTIMNNIKDTKKSDKENLNDLCVVIMNMYGRLSDIISNGRLSDIISNSLKDGK